MRILIIDDDETFCHLLVEILEEMGMPAVWTTNGLTGYEMMTRDDYELCIIDVRMPLVLGTDLAEAIREDHPGQDYSGLCLCRRDTARLCQAQGDLAAIKTVHPEPVARYG